MFDGYSILEDVNLDFSQSDINFSCYNDSIKEKSIEELAAENVTLKAKLLANLQVLREKKRIMKDNKSIKHLEEILKLPRKVFAFRVIYPDKPDIEIINKVLEYIKNQSNGKLLKQFVVNDYIYIKLNRNTYFSSIEYDIPGYCKLIQIDPKKIFKNK